MEKVSLDTRHSGDDDDSTLENDENPFIGSRKEKKAHPASETTRRKLVLLNFAMFGMSFLVYLLSVGVVPAQVLALVGDKHKGLHLALLNASGAVLTVFISPLVGMFSDRLQSTFGKRTPIMAVVVVVQCVLLFGLAWAAPNFPPYEDHAVNSSNCQPEKPVCENTKYQKSNDTNDTTEPDMLHYGVYFVVYFLVFGLYATLSVVYNGLIADMTPQHLRGFGSGLNGLMTLLGYGTGALWNIFLRDFGILATYSVIAVFLLVSVMIAVCSANEKSTASMTKLPRLTAKKIGSSFIRPLKDHDFRWVFITRFLMQMGVYTVLMYIYYWISDVVILSGCMKPERATGLAMLPLMVLGGACGGVTGHLSDRYKRRKIFVLASTLILSLASAGFLTWVTSFVGAVVVASVIGIGYGLYVTVDFALLLDVLPNEETKGNDMAVWHQSLVLPQLLAAPIAGSIVDHFQKTHCALSLGYKLIFVLAACYFLLSGVFVFKLRKVK
ncbi:uncharacterized protein [Oscarella lobularis]|uniref:uncharacterized protein n=1 Tax=Oscarella lobularis TaxID=121494 RepID=UPI0033140872